MNLPQFAIRRPVTVLVFTAALLLLGGISMTRLKLDFLPHIDFPFVGVMVPFPNGSPSQIERDITRPIEEVMSTLGNIKEISSQSEDDGCFVGIEFAFGRNLDVLRMEVKERMEKIVPELPDGAEQYTIFTFNSSDIPILVGRISSRGTDLAGSYDLLQRRVINPLSRVEGVGQVTVDGIAQKEVTIYLELDKLIEHSIDISNLFRLLDSNNIDLSLGQVRDGQQKLSVRALGQFRTVDDLRSLQLSSAGITLEDVSDIVYREPPPTYYRRINGETAIAFEIQKASGANIVEVSKRVNQTLDEIRQDPALAGVDVVLFFDQADQITNSLRGLLQSGLIGSLFAIGILLFFLRRMTTTLIVSVAIPISVIGTCVFLFLGGKSLNVLTMMGLMLAVGMLVDNAIVVLEAIHRRQERGEDARPASESGAREVAVAVTASTLTSIIVFAPIILTKGSELVIWLSEVGMTISITLLFSLLICLTLVPLLAARLRKRESKGEYRVIEWVREHYLRLLSWTAIRHPRRTGLIFVPLVIALTVLVAKATGFGPDESGDSGFKQDNLYLRLEFTDNANVTRVREYIDKVEPFLLSKADSLGIESLYTFYRSNYAAMGLFFEQTDVSEDEIQDLRLWLRENMPVHAGLEYDFGRDDRDSGRGAKTLTVTLFGEDSELLQDLSKEVVRRLELLPNLDDLRTDADDGGDEVQVRLDPVLAGKFGVRSNDVAQLLGLTFRGVGLKKIQGNDREIEMGIILEPSDRRSIENLREMPVTFENGRPIRLGQVADFEFDKGPREIRREQQKTALTVRGSYEGEEFDDVLDQARLIMNSFDLPPGYDWSFGRELRQSQEQQNQLAGNVLLALFCVYLIMAALFESFLHPLVIMICIPFAILGVVWTMMLTGTTFNLFAMIGIVILIGIVVNNGIVLLDHVNQLRRRGRSRDEAIMEGCRDRFRPIIMTAATTILGLAPLAFGSAHVAGAYYYPLARAVMGGLAASTVLTLVLLPTFYGLAETTTAAAARTFRWGMRGGPAPWRKPAAKEAGQAA